MKKILLFMFVFLFAFTLSVKGENLVTSPIKDNEGFTMDDNFNLDIRDNVSVEKEVNGSGLYIGQNITTNKNINGIGLLIASDITINSKLENGLLLAKKVTLNGIVDRDLLVISRTFDQTKDSKLNRDLFVTAERVTIEGEISRDVFIGANTIILKNGSKIGGNVRLGANKIIIEDDVLIFGKLKYNDNAITTIKDRELFQIETYKGDFINKNSKRASGLLMFIYKVVSMILLFSVIYFLFPNLFKKTEGVNENPINYLKNMGIGFVIFILTPLLALFLTVLPYTSVIGILAFIFYFICMYMSFIFVGYLLGEYLREKLLKKPLSPYVVGMFGIILIKLFTLIPGISFLIVLIGFGVIYTLIISQNKVELHNYAKLNDHVETKNVDVKEKKVVKKKTTKK